MTSGPHLLFRSIKRYFLMDQGDFFVHFMDLTEDELKKPVDDITPTRLEALLELALRMSTANTDPFKDDLKVGRGWGRTLRPAFLCPERWSSRLGRTADVKPWGDPTPAGATAAPP